MNNLVACLSAPAWVETYMHFRQALARHSTHVPTNTRAPSGDVQALARHYTHVPTYVHSPANKHQDNLTQSNDSIHKPNNVTNINELQILYIFIHTYMLRGSCIK